MADGCYATYGEGDDHKSASIMSDLKIPIGLTGKAGIASLLAAGILVLRRKQA